MQVFSLCLLIKEDSAQCFNGYDGYESIHVGEVVAEGMETGELGQPLNSKINARFSFWPLEPIYLLVTFFIGSSSK